MAVRCSDIAIIAAQHGNRITSAIVRRMSHEFGANLVIAQTEDVRVSHGQKVIQLIGAALIRKRQDPLLRQKIVQFEFPDLHVEPRRMQQVIETDKS